VVRVIGAMGTECREPVKNGVGTAWSGESPGIVFDLSNVRESAGPVLLRSVATSRGFAEAPDWLRKHLLFHTPRLGDTA